MGVGVGVVSPLGEGEIRGRERDISLPRGWKIGLLIRGGIKVGDGKRGLGGFPLGTPYLFGVLRTSN